MQELQQIQKIIDKLEKISVKTGLSSQSPTIEYWLKILNSEVKSIRRLMNEGAEEIQSFKCEISNCPVRIKYIENENTIYGIHHELLFGNLSRVIGLIQLITLVCEAKEFESIEDLHKKLNEEYKHLRTSVANLMKITGPNHHKPNNN